MVSKSSDGQSIVVQSSPPVIEGVWSLILAELEVNNFAEDDIFAVHIALQEAFLNALDHGNKMNPDKKIKINYSVDSNKVKISMADEGNGFDPIVVPDPRYGENLYKVTGRGLFLIRSYMDVIEFNKRGNCLNMVKYKKTVS